MKTNNKIKTIELSTNTNEEGKCLANIEPAGVKEQGIPPRSIPIAIGMGQVMTTKK